MSESDSAMNNLLETIRKALTGAAVCGVGAFLGGLIGGPLGMGIGSAIGATISATVLRFRSAPSVVQSDLTASERQSLLERGRRALVNSREYMLGIVLDIVTALLRCRSRKEALEAILPHIERGIAFILRELIAHLIS